MRSSLPLLVLAGGLVSGVVRSEDRLAPVVRALPTTVAQAEPAKPKKPEPPPSEAPKPEASKPQTAKTEATAAEVEAFVREHHPELAALLAGLESNHPKEYGRAIRELARIRDRLSGYREKDPRRYELELALWQSRSRVQLLSARIAMGDSPGLREDVRKELAVQADLRIALAERERARLTEQLTKVEAALAKAREQREAGVDREFRAWAKSVGVQLTDEAPAAPAPSATKLPATSAKPTSSETPRLPTLPAP